MFRFPAMSKRPASRLEFIPPVIPALVDQPPEGDGWIHEVKFDGYRTQIIVQHGEARVYTRNGHDWSTKLWPIALAGQALPCKSAIIDGEVIVCNEKGAADFNAIGRRSRRSRADFAMSPLTCCTWTGVICGLSHWSSAGRSLPSWSGTSRARSSSSARASRVTPA
jgi:ATP-dependent DNA ligase